jgi:hypothetical protein
VVLDILVTYSTLASTTPYSVMPDWALAPSLVAANTAIAAIASVA